MTAGVDNTGKRDGKMENKLLSKNQGCPFYLAAFTLEKKERWCLIPRPSDLFLQLHHFSPHRQGLPAPLASFQLLSILTKCRINYCRVENISSLEQNLKPIQALSQATLLAWLVRLLDVLKGEARREKNDTG